MHPGGLGPRGRGTTAWTGTKRRSSSRASGGWDGGIPWICTWGKVGRLGCEHTCCAGSCATHRPTMTEQLHARKGRGGDREASQTSPVATFGRVHPVRLGATSSRARAGVSHHQAQRQRTAALHHPAPSPPTPRSTPSSRRLLDL
jgi:hypothetical protein